MKKLFAALSLAVATLAGAATPYAPQEFDFGELNDAGCVALGTVESVRVLRIERDIHAFEEALELRLQPDLRDELVSASTTGAPSPSSRKVRNASKPASACGSCHIRTVRMGCRSSMSERISRVTARAGSATPRKCAPVKVKA